MTDRSRLSAVLITRDEAARLERCLDSVAWADEIVVLDSGSTDATVELARARGARVETRTFDDFASQRNAAAALARYDWILMVDGDEVVTPELRDEIAALLRASTTAHAYWLPRRNIIFGKPLRHGGHWPDYQLRLYRRGRGRFVGPVHEQLVVDGPVGRMTAALVHQGTRTIDEYLDKLRRYTSLEARELRHSRGRASAFDICIRPPAAFVRSYILQRGFLDGYPGLVTSVLGALYVLVKHLKRNEPETTPEMPPVTPAPRAQPERREIRE